MDVNVNGQPVVENRPAAALSRGSLRRVEAMVAGGGGKERVKGGTPRNNIIFQFPVHIRSAAAGSTE